jgi:hypothetical protein
VFYPGLKLGPHWFVYSSIHVSSTPFYYYDSYQPDHQVETHVVQAFLGYTQNYGATSLVVKVGKLASAFGAFPLHYDDADNPFLDQPLPTRPISRFAPTNCPVACPTFLVNNTQPPRIMVVAAHWAPARD